MAKTYDLSWKEVYEIDSEFQSLIKAEKVKLDQLEAKIQKLKFTHTQLAKEELKVVEVEMNSLVQRRYGEVEPGITFITFNEYEKMFNGKT